jgi:hypothetical protein
MNKGTGYALGFLLVLAVVALGFYVAYTSFQSSRAALLFQPTQAPRTSTPTSRPKTAAASTATPSVAPVVTATLALTATLEPSATPVGQGARPANTARPSETPAPPPATVPSASSFAFRLAGPPAPETVGVCCYIRGTVRDAAGSGLADVVLQMTDEWGNVANATTKAGTEAGVYDFPLAVGQQPLTFRIKIVDAQGTVISTQVEVTFDPAVAPSYRVDWRRNY